MPRRTDKPGSLAKLRTRAQKWKARMQAPTPEGRRMQREIARRKLVARPDAPEPQ